eukprot:CAMPEP_0197581082 /NCGR_PEP_ID=MMETSP1326-20131121/4698_1 /TAXON_ID=1155430 /ORGANISM="Genus nov. species nov., Strain RCC2288" /LENGTH=381 /DNA_ID=CAMNT_0043144937 /DNA_START=42 /DNA_END=1187 /DNA_ORIENTATION=+
MAEKPSSSSSSGAPHPAAAPPPPPVAQAYQYAPSVRVPVGLPASFGPVAPSFAATTTEHQQQQAQGNPFPTTSGPMYHHHPNNLMYMPSAAAGAQMGQQHALGEYERVMSAESQQYVTNLLDCTTDWDSCCYGAFCTPCQVGEWAEEARAGDCCATGCVFVALTQLNQLVPCLGSVLAGGFLAGTANRAAAAYGITEHTDFVTACVCAPCVSCRMAREVKARRNMGQLPVDFHAMHGGGMSGGGGMGGMSWMAAPEQMAMMMPPMQPQQHPQHQHPQHPQHPQYQQQQQSQPARAHQHAHAHAHAHAHQQPGVVVNPSGDTMVTYVAQVAPPPPCVAPPPLASLQQVACAAPPPLASLQPPPPLASLQPPPPTAAVHHDKL